MIITTSQKNLKEALGVVEKIVSKNTSLPILQNIILKTENGRLRLSSTNLEIGINFWIGGKIEEEGEVAVPARIFSDFINNLKETNITIKSKGDILLINSNNHQTKIISFSAKDFPIIPKPKEESFIVLNSGELFELFNTVIDAVSISEARPELSGVFINFSEKSIESAATDSFHLAEKFINTKSKVIKSVIIPRQTVQELIRIFSGLTGDISLSISENQIFFTSSDLEIVSRLIDGRYPDYKKVIPEKWISKVLTNKSDLEKNIRLASVFSSNISDIKISAEEKGLIISAKNSDRGEISSLIEASLKNDRFELSVNYRYFLDGLKVIPTENVILEFTGEGNPLILRPEGRNDITYLIMPLRS